MHHPPHRVPNAFTLIELLVVITIIVVLLALLTPALDKAIYQAELAVCGAQQKGIASGVSTYAMNFKRFYPIRHGAVDPFNTNYQPKQLSGNPLTNQNNAGNANTETTAAYYDERPVLRGWVNVDAWVDPLAGDMKVSDDLDNTVIFTALQTFWSYKYQGGGSPMLKVGQRLSVWDNKFSILASDHAYVGGSFNFVDASAHADDRGKMTQYQNDDKPPAEGAGLLTATTGTDKRTTSFGWSGSPRGQIGTMDFNFAFDDGAVRRFDKVFWRLNPAAATYEERMAPVPVNLGGGAGVPNVANGDYLMLPRAK